MGEHIFSGTLLVAFFKVLLKIIFSGIFTKVWLKIAFLVALQ
jgi:hypothetical protein